MISMMIRIYNVILCKIWTGRIVTSEIAFRELNIVIRTQYIAPPTKHQMFFLLSPSIFLMRNWSYYRVVGGWMIIIYHKKQTKHFFK